MFSFRKQYFRNRGPELEAKAIQNHNFSEIANSSTWNDQYDIKKWFFGFCTDFNLFGIISTQCLKKNQACYLLVGFPECLTAKTFSKIIIFLIIKVCQVPLDEVHQGNFLVLNYF